MAGGLLVVEDEGCALLPDKQPCASHKFFRRRMRRGMNTYESFDRNSNLGINLSINLHGRDPSPLALLPARESL